MSDVREPTGSERPPADAPAGAHTATAEPPGVARYDRAVAHAEAGRLSEAAALFEELAGGADPRERARAALGLAVVRHDQGDPEAARLADELAIGTGDPEFAPRAACHLAVCREQAGDPEGARAAWHRVLDFERSPYAGIAHRGLAAIAAAAGEHDQARRHWQDAIDTGDPEALVPAAQDLAQHHLDRGDPERACQVLELALRGADDPGLRAVLAIGRLEQAIAALAGAGERGLPDAGRGGLPLAVELLGRLLPLRGRAEEAADVWRAGLGHPDPGVAAEVRARLRRGFPVDPGAGGAAGPGPAVWWEEYLESAVAHDRLPVLADEAFAALDRVCAALAAEGGAASGAAAAAEVTAAYGWGGALAASVADRSERPGASAGGRD
ncbi:tetratricopeptide repeat protein [Allonocardiopsis opalescens]|uniref:Tetratricopeptide repeat protein n=1 Tax=Allonocardiopsis opalescens TaxID=1144618 RepID=A0A2T0Q4Y4_9ACTN|nr:tetratricopeptide repeat protein [Allonocardiopsis opalescens]PRX98761.1 hypothetical protein CLV72_104341 [Allonocardiopsis opalescens]